MDNNLKKSDYKKRILTELRCQKGNQCETCNNKNIKKVYNPNSWVLTDECDVYWWICRRCLNKNWKLGGK